MIISVLVRTWMIWGLLKVLYAQELYTYPIPDAARLPTREIYQIHQDKEGFIWIAGDAGLHQYDGLRFREYLNPIRGRQSLSDIQISETGSIACKDFNGNIYKVQGDTLAHILNIENTDPAGTCYTTDNHDNIWYVSSQLLIQVDKNGKRNNVISLKHALQSQLIIDIIYYDNTIYWLDRKGNAGSYHIVNKIIQLYPAYTQIAPYTYMTLLKIDKTIYRVLETDRLYMDNILKPASIPIPLFLPIDKGRIHAMQFQNHTLFVNTGRGVHLFKFNQSGLKHEAHYLKNMSVSWSFIDRENLVWFATLQDGIWISPDINFKIYNQFSKPGITALKAIDENTLLIGNYNGDVFRMNLNTGAYQVLPVPDKSEKISVKKIYALDDQVVILRGTTDIYKHLDKNPRHIKARNIRALHIGKQSSYLLFPDHLKSIRTDSLAIIGDMKSIDDTIPGGYDVYCIDSTQTCYFALINGLFMKKGNTWQEITHANHSILTRNLSARSDTLFLTTANAGLLIIHKGKVIHSYVPKSVETFKNICYCNEFIFAVSHNNLIQYKIKVINTGIKLELQNLYNIRDISALSCNSVHLFAGTGNGVIQIPILHRKSTIDPGIQIQAVRVQSEIKNHKLPIPILAQQNGIEIEYRISSYSDRIGCRVEYQIQEKDSTWHIADAGNNMLFIASLPSGKNTMILRARNTEGRISKPVFLQFEVETPIHKSPLLYITILSVFSLITFLFVRFRIQQIQQHEDLKVRTAKSQLAALKSNMNPHFIFNALNSLQAFILKKDIQQSNRFLSRFSLLIRDILQNSEHIFIPLEKEISILKAYLEIESVRFDNCFSWTIDMQNIQNSQTILIPAMIIQPIVENAVKYGINPEHANNFISIRMQMIEKQILQIEIEDSGNSKPEQIHHPKNDISDYTSFGLKSVQERLHLLEELTGIRCSFNYRKSNQTSGTCVSLSFPVHTQNRNAFQT